MIKIAVLSENPSFVREMTKKVSLGGFVAVSPAPDELKEAVLFSIGVLLLDGTVNKRGALQAAPDFKLTGLPPTMLVLSAGSESLLEKIDAVDDFIIEPYSEAELWLRLKRLGAANGDNRRIKVEGLVINPDTYEVRIDDKLLHLTFKEYELLKFLAGRPDRVWDRHALLSQIWGYDYFGGTRTVDVHVRRLRAKLGAKYGGLIQTVRQVGYKFSRG